MQNSNLILCLYSTNSKFRIQNSKFEYKGLVPLSFRLHLDPEAFEGGF